MIQGIGTDICDVRRMRASFERHGERFARRVLGDAEFAVWQARSTRWPERGLRYLATRFSAKEAFSKAIGTGIHQPMSWRACEILNHPSGQPYIRLRWRAQNLVRGAGPARACDPDRRERLRGQLRGGREGLDHAGRAAQLLRQGPA